MGLNIYLSTWIIPTSILFYTFINMKALFCVIMIFWIFEQFSTLFGLIHTGPAGYLPYVVIALHFVNKVFCCSGFFWQQIVKNSKYLSV